MNVPIVIYKVKVIISFFFTQEYLPPSHLTTLTPCQLISFSPFLPCHLITIPPFPPCHLITLQLFPHCHLITLPHFTPFHLTTLPPTSKALQNNNIRPSVSPPPTPYPHIIFNKRLTVPEFQSKLISQYPSWETISQHRL